VRVCCSAASRRQAASCRREREGLLRTRGKRQAELRYVQVRTCVLGCAPGTAWRLLLDKLVCNKGRHMPLCEVLIEVLTDTA
jgi:hypothetical protein